MNTPTCRWKRKARSKGRKPVTGSAQILIRSHVKIAQEDDRARAFKLLHKAQGLCLVSRALSVEQKFEPHVQVGECGR